MNINRPLDDFIKDSLREKRAERKRAAAERRAKQKQRSAGFSPNSSSGKGKAAEGRDEEARGRPSMKPTNRSFKRRRATAKRRRVGAGRKDAVAALSSGPSKPVSPPRNPVQDSPSFDPSTSPRGGNQSLSPPLHRDEPPSIDRSVTVAVSNLHPGVTQADITELFETVGPLKRASLHHRPAGVKTGQAEVVFENMEDALDAIKRYNHVPLDNLPLHITLVTGHVNVGRRASSSSYR